MLNVRLELVVHGRLPPRDALLAGEAVRHLLLLAVCA